MRTVLKKLLRESPIYRIRNILESIEHDRLSRALGIYSSKVKTIRLLEYVNRYRLRKSYNILKRDIYRGNKRLTLAKVVNKNNSKNNKEELRRFFDKWINAAVINGLLSNDSEKYHILGQLLSRRQRMSQSSMSQEGN